MAGFGHKCAAVTKLPVRMTGSSWWSVSKMAFKPAVRNVVRDE
jgi:hypothetical protein